GSVVRCNFRWYLANHITITGNRRGRRVMKVTPREYFEQMTEKMSPTKSYPYTRRNPTITSKTTFVSQRERRSPLPQPVPKLDSNQISLTPFSVQNSPLTRQSSVGLSFTSQYRQRTDTCYQDTLHFHTQGISLDIEDFQYLPNVPNDEIIEVTDESIHRGDTPE